jgi:spore coat protein CotH
MTKKSPLRFLALILSLLTLCLSFAGCAGCGDNQSSANNGDEPEGTLKDFEAEPVYYSLVYENGENGKLIGELEQSVLAGTDGKQIRAMPSKGYVFVGWSDGDTSQTRIDKSVYADIKVKPIFVKSGTKFTVNYELRKDGEVIETVKLEGKAGKEVTYTPPDAPFAYPYEWSDGTLGPKHVAGYLSKGETIVVSMVPRSLNEVPTIEIFTEDGTGITSKHEYKNCTVTLSNAESDENFENLTAQIRGRGNSSWNAYPKKGFKLKFDKKQSMLGSDYALKNWVFISNHGDKSLVRNMIAYDMSAKLSGLEFTTMHEYIDVYLDGEYYGLFMMCDRIDENEGRLNIETGVLDDPSQMGYIIEIGMTDRLGTGKDGWAEDRDKNRSYSISYPDIDDPNFKYDVHMAYIEDYFDQCLAALSDKNWEKICELMDIDSFVDYYILQELFMNKDCFWRSVHFHKKPNGKLYAGPAWDFDQTIGNANDLFGLGQYDATPDCDINFTDNQHNSGKQAGSLWIADANTWYRRLLRNEEFVALVQKRLREVQPIVEELLALTTTDGSNPNAYYTRYSKAMERNFKRWTIMGQPIWPNTPILREIDTVKGQIDYVNDWLGKRYVVLCNWYKVEL